MPQRAERSDAPRRALSPVAYLCRRRGPCSDDNASALHPQIEWEGHMVRALQRGSPRRLAGRHRRRQSQTGLVPDLPLGELTHHDLLRPNHRLQRLPHTSVLQVKRCNWLDLRAGLCPSLCQSPVGCKAGALLDSGRGRGKGPRTAFVRAFHLPRPPKPVLSTVITGSLAILRYTPYIRIYGLRPAPVQGVPVLSAGTVARLSSTNSKLAVVSLSTRIPKDP